MERELRFASLTEDLPDPENRVTPAERDRRARPAAAADRLPRHAYT